MPTKAHLALKSIIELLRANKKNVYVYTENVDGLFKAAEIEEETTPKLEFSSLSSLQDLIVVNLGASSDLGNIMSGCKYKFPVTKLFLFNIKPTKFLKISFKSASDPEATSVTGFLDLDGEVLGDLQQTLPALRDALIKKLGNQEASK